MCFCASPSSAVSTTSEEDGGLRGIEALCAFLSAAGAAFVQFFLLSVLVLEGFLTVVGSCWTLCSLAGRCWSASVPTPMSYYL